MICPSCHTESSGAYCPECGTPLRARCKECEAALVAGAHYCTECGEPVRRAGSNLPWYVAGAALVALIVVVLLPRSGQPGAAAGDLAASPAPAMGGAPAGADAPGGMTAPGPLTGTPREQADRLFNRIMQLRESGDTARARFFLPMGLQAYQMAGDLDADGLFHLSVLQNFAGESAEARKTAERVLATSPDHLLALAAAAEAADALGDKDAARGYYKRLLDDYDAQSATKLPEYQEHSAALAQYRDDARAYLAR